MTIISSKHKFIVVLNPKCGNTYLQQNLKKYHDFPIYIYKHTTILNVKNILQSHVSKTLLELLEKKYNIQINMSDIINKRNIKKILIKK